MLKLRIKYKYKLSQTGLMIENQKYCGVIQKNTAINSTFISSGYTVDIESEMQQKTEKKKLNYFVGELTWMCNDVNNAKMMLTMLK